MIIHVDKGLNKPYQTTNGKFLIRVGSTNRSVTQGELLRLFQQAGVFHFDRVPVEGTSFAHLNTVKVARYFEHYDIEFTQNPQEEQIQLLKNADILHESGQVTVAGLLIFGTFPQKTMPHASIVFASFPGNDIDDELNDRQVIEGNLDIQIDSATRVIKNHLPTPSHISGNKREEITLLPEKVLRELLVNACVHRNYSLSGSRIRVFLFADRLGRGLPMVSRDAERRGFPAIFREFGEEFHVILPFA